jgi:2-polyprenyl-3-methyl-5-hydroxy-6-metoxy-1,4-benzoquinol methylase
MLQSAPLTGRSERRCLVCQGDYQSSALPGLLQCKTCSFTTANVDMTPEALRQLYTAKYFSGDEYRDYVAERGLFEKHFRLRLKTLLRCVPDPASKRLLEIGAAYGFFLTVVRNHFKSVEGIDISTDAVAYARQTLGLNVVAGDFLEYPIAAPVDVVCMWDTIEHLQHPHLYVECAAANMNRGGVIAITTGDIDSLMARWRGAKWRQIHPPTHLHYFSKATLAKLLDRYGFTVRYAGSDGVYRSLDTIAYIVLNIKRQQPKLYAALRRTGLLGFDFYLNLYDIMFLIAEKR